MKFIDHPLSRRSMLSRFALGGAVLLGSPGTWPSAWAVEPLPRQGKPRFQLSLAAYSFRDYYGKPDPRSKDGKPLDIFGFIDYCAEKNCAAELTSYYFPKNLNREVLLEIRRKAFLSGVTVSGAATRSDFGVEDESTLKKEIAHVKEWIEFSALLGAPCLRIFAGDRIVGSLEDTKKRCAQALQECGEHAGKYGIFLGVENHGRLAQTSEVLLDILKLVQSPWVGVNLDTGNFRSSDPYRDMERCAPYAVNVQYKAELVVDGKSVPADINRILAILKKANYQGFVVLEYESKEDPWQAVPRLLEEMRALFGRGV